MYNLKIKLAYILFKYFELYNVISIKKSRLTMIRDQHFVFSVFQLVISNVISHFLASSS